MKIISTTLFIVLLCASAAHGQVPYCQGLYGAQPCPIQVAPGYGPNVADIYRAGAWAANAGTRGAMETQQLLAAGAEVARQKALAQAAIALAQQQAELVRAQAEAVRLQNQQLQQSLQRQASALQEQSQKQNAELEAAQAEEQRREAALQERWLNKLAIAYIAHPDWDEVANSPQAGQMAIHPFLETAIKEMENGPDVLYYIVKHPEAYHKLEALTVFQGIGEVYRISDNLTAGK